MDYRVALKKTIKGIGQMFPIILGVLLLISFVMVGIPTTFYARIFTGNPISDPLIGAAFGSIAIGSPITSYILGGELLKNGISMVAITAFIVCWVSVGVLQLPAEALFLGKRFAIIRGIVSFIAAIIIALLATYTQGLIYC